MPFDVLVISIKIAKVQGNQCNNGHKKGVS
jgi:hypothetical protein